MSGSSIPRGTPNNAYRQGVSDSADKVMAEVDKFKQAAREAETDNSEAAFDRALKVVAKASEGKPEPQKRQ